MLDIKFVRENPELVKENIKKKFQDSKLLLVDEVGAIVNEVTHEYPLIFPHPGWSEQKPEDWWSAVVTGVPELLRGFDASEVAGIGSGGQMHGLVALDEADNVIDFVERWAHVQRSRLSQ